MNVTPFCIVTINISTKSLKLNFSKHFTNHYMLRFYYKFITVVVFSKHYFIYLFYIFVCNNLNKCNYPKVTELFAKYIWLGCKVLFKSLEPLCFLFFNQCFCFSRAIMPPAIDVLYYDFNISVYSALKETCRFLVL